ncbi:MAG: PAM68 family protein, partial [Cyanobacteria bacterium J06649_4]
SENVNSNKAKPKKTEPRKADKSTESKISAKAQARVDDIRAANRKRAAAKAKTSSSTSGADSDGAIPKVVSNRMLRRMAILSMGPIAVGVSIFFIAYYLLSQQIVEFAPVLVLLTTMGCFGLGVVGLTYGMLSASWDEEPGSLVGLDEFKLNLGRMVDAWKESRASKT